MGLNLTATLPAQLPAWKNEVQPPMGTHMQGTQTQGTRIMVVEDDDSLRTWIQFELSFAGYEVADAANGALALAALRHADPPPDVILLDVQMPGMDGYAVCAELQRFPTLAAVPVIFLTARAELDDKLAGFAAGGSDYLVKPFKMAELQARISAVLRQTERNRTLGRRQEHDAVNREMDEAATIQRSLMHCTLGDVAGVDVVANCHPARLVGGDLYDIYPRKDGRLSLVEADVSGKGMAAAMVTATVRTLLRELDRQIASPAAVLALANRRLYDDLTEVNKLVTIFAAHYSPADRTLTYANGGHTLVVYAPVRGLAHVLEPTGMPFGIFDQADFDEQTVPFGPGDLLVMASDGFAEAHNRDNAIFGYDHLLDEVAAAAHLPAATIALRLEQRIADFVQGNEQFDDQTLVVLKGKP